MLEEIKKYQNLGSLTYFQELLLLFIEKSHWKIYDIEKYFYNRVIEGQYIFDGGVFLLTKLGILIENNGIISISNSFGFLNQLNSREFESELNKIIISNVFFRDYFTELFSPGFVSFDLKEKVIRLNNNAFPLKFSNIKQLLINISLIQKPVDKQLSYSINQDYFNLIIDNAIPKESQRKYDLNQLRKQLEKNQKYGEEAESFVLDFEKRRIGLSKQIIQISEIDVCAGYDILSYHLPNDHNYNRYIEVKSYTGRTHFYWSKNEIEKSKIYNENYYLYLVDRSRINDGNYSPEIIKNPYKNIFGSDEWGKDINLYFIYKI